MRGASGFVRCLNMIPTDSLYNACLELFDRYPLAAETLNGNEPTRSMILMLQDGDDARFFVLSADYREGRASFSLSPWREDGTIDIEPGSGAISSVAAEVVARAIPLPRDGSLFGWLGDGTLSTALIGIQARYTPESPMPLWGVMPLAGAKVLWPPFTDNLFFGRWFWEYHDSGQVVLLDPLIAGTSHVVFWLDTKDILGSDCCAVARDVTSTEGFTLQHGCYVQREALRVGKSVPPLARLLADMTKTDLASRFRRWRTVPA
jgi:hypothetical protein